MVLSVSIGSDKQLIPGDANGSGNITISDVGGLVTEYGGGQKNRGVPDCNLTGDITVADIGCLVNKL